MNTFKDKETVPGMENGFKKPRFLKNVKKPQKSQI